MRTKLALLAALFAALAPMAAQAQEAAPGIDQTINQIFADYTGWYVALMPKCLTRR